MALQLASVCAAWQQLVQPLLLLPQQLHRLLPQQQQLAQLQHQLLWQPPQQQIAEHEAAVARPPHAAQLELRPV
jgi:hypothetical protein